MLLALNEFDVCVANPVSKPVSGDPVSPVLIQKDESAKFGFALDADAERRIGNAVRAFIFSPMFKSDVSPIRAKTLWQLKPNKFWRNNLLDVGADHYSVEFFRAELACTLVQGYRRSGKSRKHSSE